MTDAPKTLSLNARQWRVLLNDHLDVLKSAVQSTEGLNEDGLRNIYKHLDEMKMQATAWFQVSVPVQVAEATPPEQEPVADAAPVKRKGGWPKGMPRKSRNGAQAVQ